jgi:cell division protease FtsH
MSLGVTISSPDAERTNYDFDYLTARIKVALGGRVAEETVYGSISAGAESDIQQLTGIARQMVGRWGMSEAVGPIAVIPSESQGPLLPGVSEVSEATQELIDREVRRIVDEAYHAVTQLLTEHREKLDSLTERLLEKETLDMDEAYEAAGVPVPRGKPEEEATVI